MSTLPNFNNIKQNVSGVITKQRIYILKRTPKEMRPSEISVSPYITPKMDCLHLMDFGKTQGGIHTGESLFIERVSPVCIPSKGHFAS
jgi:hypothetical protein